MRGFERAGEDALDEHLEAAREAARLHLVGSLDRYRQMMGRVERHA